MSAHPTLEIESCSSGGGRVDLGVLERTDRIWVSDNIDPHDRQGMLRWTTQLIPPEYMGSHIASGRSHTTGRRHDLGFRAATAVFGHLGIEWDLTEAADDELAELGAWISFYKRERGLLLGGDLVRIDVADPRLLVHGVVAPDRSRAIFAAASIDSLYPDPPGAAQAPRPRRPPSVPRTTDPGRLRSRRAAATRLVGVATRDVAGGAQVPAASADLAARRLPGRGPDRKRPRTRRGREPPDASRSGCALPRRRDGRS